MKTNAPAAPVATPPIPQAAGDGLRDVVDPTIIPIWQWIAGIALALLILGLIALAFVLWWRARKRRLNQPPPTPPPLPPHVRARLALEAALGLLPDPDRFCTEVSRILRHYLEDRFGWHAPERTTEEFLRELQGASELHDDQQRVLADFLTRCDLVKFARHDPTEPELRDLLRVADRLVTETTPSPSAPLPAATGGGASPS